LPSPWIPEPQRKNDRFLMEILRTASSTTLRDSPLRSINRCRLFLQVTTLSDITDGTGKYILEDVHKGSANGIRDQKSTYKFPPQAHPQRTYFLTSPSSSPSSSSSRYKWRGHQYGRWCGHHFGSLRDSGHQFGRWVAINLGGGAESLSASNDATIALGASEDFAVLAAATATHAGSLECDISGGKLGVYPSTSIRGNFVGDRVSTPDSAECAAAGLAAWNEGTALSGTAMLAEMGGLTFTPGVHTQVARRVCPLPTMPPSHWAQAKTSQSWRPLQPPMPVHLSVISVEENSASIPVRQSGETLSATGFQRRTVLNAPQPDWPPGMRELH
jgi:hypothetical protein